ncbi:MAG: YicC family protein [Fibrobacteres bacterium]|nr:YicC family protein [Fibrobacterota bacterium]
MASKPIYSMTGFGRIEKACTARRVTAELKSVNNRFLEIQIKGMSLPVDTESRVLQIIREKIGRGSVYLNLSVTDTAGLTSPPALNLELLKYYAAFYKEASLALKISEEPSISKLMSLPDVIKLQNKGAADPTLEADLLEAVNGAINAMNSMRAIEGAALAKDLLARIANIRTLTIEAEKLAPERTEAYRKRLEEKSAELFKDGLDDTLKARLMMEIMIMADRTDVSEEITRLKSHCSQVEETLKNGGAAGKKLNFIQQEIGREANTLSSKAQDSALLKVALAIKEECESMREQIQNLE